MKTIKFSGICLILIFLASSPTNAQIDVNTQLWDMFHKLKVPVTPDIEPFFWDLSSHTTKYDFYSPTSPDTGTTYNFWALYFEMANSAYVPGTLNDINTERSIADGLSDNDTVPIGIMDCGYNILRDDAFTAGNGVYLNWNNDSVWPLPDVNPFALDPATSNYRWIIFNAAPMVQRVNYRNVTFSIDPTLIFNGPSYNLDPIKSTDVVTINFGDGSGWHTIPNLNTKTLFSIVYPYRGIYYIEVKVVNDGGFTIRDSKSRFEVIGNLTLKQPDEWLTNISGLNVGVYLGCGHDSIIKPVIYLEGIDILESRHVADIYKDMINTPGLNMLRNYDYDFIVVDWGNSRDNMQDNAQRVEFLLEYLMTKVHDTTQFVVIGESMGGVIGRFALTEMETPLYISGTPGISPPHPKSHNTRLFITIDAPQQGAIVPLAAQAEVDFFYAMPNLLVETAFSLSDLERNADILTTNVLSQPAVKQLLIYHDQARTGSGTYPPLSDHTDFYNELVSLNPSSNGYPVHCKTMALSNGLMDGKNQVGFRDSIMGPGKKYMDLSFSVKVDILRLFKLPVCDLSTTLYTEPNGTGPIINDNLTYYTINLAGCLVSLLQATPLLAPPCFNAYSLGLTENAVDVLPMETGSGGYYPSIGDGIHNPSTIGLPLHHHHVDWFVFESDYTIDSVTGNVSYQAEAGILASASMAISISADVIDFCFIPYYSSLDYTIPGGTPLNEDILDDPASLNLSRTNYDVIVGGLTNPLYPNDDYTDAGTENYEHLYERADAVSGYDHATYLNREIGDFAMNLDNLDINRPAHFQATQTIRAGSEESPYYTYASFTGAFPGMFSKNNGFVDDASGGDVVFKAGKEIRLDPDFEAQNGSSFRAYIVPEDTCSLTWGQFQSVRPPEKQEFWTENNNNTETIAGLNADTGSKKFTVYPNPSQNLFNVTMPPAPQTKAALYDVFGKQIAIFDVSDQKQFVIDAGKYGLANGMYFLVVNTKNKTYTEKLVINH